MNARYTDALVEAVAKAVGDFYTANRARLTPEQMAEEIKAVVIRVIKDHTEH